MVHVDLVRDVYRIYTYVVYRPIACLISLRVSTGLYYMCVGVRARACVCVRAYVRVCGCYTVLNKTQSSLVLN